MTMKVGESTPFIAQTGTRKVSGTAPLDGSAATDANTKIDPMSFLAAGKSMVKKSKDRDFNSNFFNALQNLKQNAIQTGKGDIGIKADDGKGEPIKLQAKVAFSDKGLMVKGTLKTGDGQQFKFKLAASGGLESGSTLKFKADAKGDGIDAHVSGKVKFA